MKKREQGFTMVELLTVIAIIAILAAILLPVLSRTREKARQVTCMANLQQIAQALRLYKQDNRGFPLDVLDPRRPIGNNFWYGPLGNDKNPQVAGYGLGTLFPSYVKTHKIFNCPNAAVKSPATVAAAAPDFYTGPGRDGYMTYDGWDPAWTSMVTKIGGLQVPYTDSSRFATAQNRIGLKYSQWWAVVGNNINRAERRQLCWRNPDEETVVTWCHRHRSKPDWTTVASDDRDLVVWLSGNVKSVNTKWQSGHGAVP